MTKAILFKVIVVVGGLVVGILCGLPLIVYLTSLSQPLSPSPAFTPTSTFLSPATSTPSANEAGIPAPQTPTPLPDTSSVPAQTTRAESTPDGYNQDWVDAVVYMDTHRYAEAITSWDRVIANEPTNGLAYAYRGLSYMGLNKNQRSLYEFLDYTDRALADLDMAVILGSANGDVYYNRHQLYRNLADIQDRRVDHDAFVDIALQNLRMAVSLGTNDVYNYRTVPLLYFFQLRCDEGMRELQRIREFETRSAPPSTYLYSVESDGYLCLGDLEKALEAHDRGQAIEFYPEDEWQRIVILYQMGRSEDALQVLDDHIAADPYYHGFRYYLRALIYYEDGRVDEALADLEMGSANTWFQMGLRSYVLGRIALDEGSRDEGTALLQEAYSSLPWELHTLLPRIKIELAALGAEPQAETPDPGLYVTPMPTPAFDRLQRLPVENIPGKDFPLPPNATPVSLESGSGEIDKGDVPLVLLFQLNEPVTIRSVEELTLLLTSPAGESGPTTFQVFLWNPESGDWTMVKTSWGENPIENPGSYVDAQGNIYIYIRSKARIENAWFSLTVVTVEGQVITLGLDQ